MIHGHHHTHPKLRFIFLTSILFYSSFLIAHGDEIEVNTSGPAQSVTLTPKQTKMLGIEVSEATPRPMAELLTLNGQIQLLPNAQADVSVRISGAVTELVANLGDSVTKGQVLATVQSRLVGDPPPSVAVKAPISGVIDARNVNLGQAVEPNTVLFHISNREQLLAIVQVYEEDLGKIKAGQDVNVQYGVIRYCDDEYTEIKEGLVPGDAVVIQGNRELYTLSLTGGGTKKPGKESH